MIRITRLTRARFEMAYRAYKGQKPTREIALWERAALLYPGSYISFVNRLRLSLELELERDCETTCGA